MPRWTITNLTPHHLSLHGWNGVDQIILPKAPGSVEITSQTIADYVQATAGADVIYTVKAAKRKRLSQRKENP